MFRKQYFNKKGPSWALFGPFLTLTNAKTLFLAFVGVCPPISSFCFQDAPLCATLTVPNKDICSLICMMIDDGTLTCIRLQVRHSNM